MHWILAITNSCNGLRYVTRFSCDIFGFYVAFIYLQKGIQVLTRQFGQSGDTSAYLSIMIALLVLMIGYGCGVVGGSTLLQRYIRKFVEDYGTPLTIIFFTGFVHIGKMRGVEIATLPTSKAFFPTLDRGWFIHFWDIDVGDVFIALPFAILLTILFWFDHNGMFLLSNYELKISLIMANFSFFSHRARHRVPPSKTCRISLGHLPVGSYNGCGRSSGHSLSQRSHTTSSISHQCIMCYSTSV